MAATITLTPDQAQTLRQAQKMLHDILPDIDGLENCGVDCQQLRAQNQAIRDQITALQTNFGGVTKSNA
jgi:hypothetical protein